MRLPRFIPVILLLSLLIFLGIKLRGFIRLFFSHSGIALTQPEIQGVYERRVANGTYEEEVPRIIHQVFHNWRQPGNETIPADWDEARKGCRERNRGWEYRLWTESSSTEFIEDHYPWFLDTYNGYRFPVQRVDSLRYFLLLHFGGIYMDLDNGCRTSLDPLLAYPVFLTDGGHGALSNNILGARPNHPFWELITSSLIPYNYNYFFPYITISYASGQWFETAIWEKYHRLLRQGKIAGESEELVRVMMDGRDGKADEWVFFSEGRGGSWVNWDNYFFVWIGDHLLLEGFVVLLAGAVCWVLIRCCCGKWRGSRKGGRKGRYKKIDELPLHGDV